MAHWVGQLGRAWSAILGYARREGKITWQKKKRREHPSLPSQTESEGTGVTFEGGEGGSSEVTSEGSEDGRTADLDDTSRSGEGSSGGGRGYHGAADKEPAS